MQPDQTGAEGTETRWAPIEGECMAVDSRRRALDRLRAAFRAGLAGPVLITGEPGVGKSWLAGRFAEGLPAGWRSAEVEIASALDGLELLRLAADPLGLELADRLGVARLRLGAGLRDELADGRSWLLILDEVQRASAGAWEEIQALSNQLGRPGGFAAMILLGETALARELSMDRRRGWAGRLGLHIHLPPLDLDEARALLRPEGGLGEAELEAIHRDARGNPRAMLRIAAARGLTPGRVVAEPLDPDRRVGASWRFRTLPAATEGRPDAEAAPPAGRDLPAPADDLPAPADDLPARRHPSLIPARPPIRFEEGLVEVGWEGDLEAEPTTRPEPTPIEAEALTPAEGDRDEELVEDRYAALQAWAEWSRNRERSAPAAVDPPADDPAPGDVDEIEPHPAEPASAHVASGPLAVPSVRAEPPQDFAPYGPLFGRLRHSL